MDLMERRRRAVRLDIQRAAVELFEEHGCEAVTVEQIVAAAGVSTSTFHRFCATKEDAVTCHLETAADDLALALERRPGASLLRAAREGVQEVFGAVDAPPLDVRRTIALCLQQPPLTARWLAVGRAGQQRVAEVVGGEQIGPGTERAEVLAGAVMAAVLTAFEHWALDGGSLLDRLDRCLAVLEHLDVPLPDGPGGA